MRTVTEQTTNAWKGEVKAGATRPVVRATIEWGNIRETQYNTDDMQGGELTEFGHRTRKGTFRNIVFGNHEIRELRNVRSFSWSRSVDQDIAEATLTLLNTDVTPIGDVSEVAGGDDFDLPGLFTFSRGAQEASAARWGYDTDTGWSQQLCPDRLVRTYEGYGSDDEVPPGEDPHLYASGVWLVDDVVYNANGDIQLKMRDLGRLLVDHIVFPPVIPRDDYPLEWEKIQTQQVEARDSTGGSFNQPPGTVTSSNSLYIGEGLVDTPDYVNSTGGVQGHYPHHAWTAGGGIGNEMYWLSTGQSSNDDMVWWEVELDDPTSIAALKVSSRSGPYRVYVSVGDDDGWRGKKKIPYKVTTGGIDIEANIKFVASFKSESGFPLDVVLPKVYDGITKVRLTITRLRMLTPALNYPWRAGLRNVELYTGGVGELGFAPGTISMPIGNYRDFSQIIRWVGAWAGWYWPQNATMQYETFGTDHDFSYSTEFASSLPKGRTWGSFQWCGTAGQAKLTADQFDKQPLLDVISHVREITGFAFWIDEAGAMSWRMPNIFAKGNYLVPGHLTPNRTPERTEDFITIDENETLISYSTTLSSKNVRERVFVGDTQGKRGAVVKGYRPNGGTGLMRIAGWTDGNWVTNQDCYVAADLIVARQMFDYRRADITIPGNPAIQIDDQIRVFERITNETYFHYVLGISSEINMDDGTWEYNLETHWLGEDIDTAFVLDADQLGGATKAYLDLNGSIS